MSKLLNVGEVIEFAVHIEQNGFKFYDEIQKKFDDKKFLELFQYLGSEELNHEKTFKNLLKNAGSFTPAETYAGEYDAYMRDFLKIHALGNDEALAKKLEEIKTIEAAVSMALEFEKDSIVLFTMLKKYIGGKGSDIVENIIHEELSHIHRITAFYNEMKD
ncbi:MAG: ferritin family protein [Candidatus Aminicenantes bacterium]|nr:ferritin family protein [Candidatus Aminicenantes bacterium]